MNGQLKSAKKAMQEYNLNGLCKTSINTIGIVFYFGFSLVILWSYVWSDQCKHYSGHSGKTQTCTVDDGGCLVLWSCGSLLLFMLWMCNQMWVLSLTKYQQCYSMQLTTFDWTRTSVIFLYLNFSHMTVSGRGHVTTPSCISCDGILPVNLAYSIAMMECAIYVDMSFVCISNKKYTYMKTFLQNHCSAHNW